MPKITATSVATTATITPTPDTAKFRTAESVSPRHPDKICDQISDAILDAHLREDPYARVAVDVAGGHGAVFVTGEVTSKAANVDITAIVHRVAGPTGAGKPLEVIIRVEAQSPEIAAGVNTGGAGDQGIMIGYATNETPELLPLEYVLARNLNQYLYKIWPYDGKTQVTIRGREVASIVASFQNAPTAELKEAVKEWGRTQGYVGKLFVDRAGSGAAEPAPEPTTDPELHINPAGDWQIGGFDADAGLTGRKLAVDNYGPRVPLGGGAFSGKDGTKVDRSGAYIARQIAVDYLQARGASEVFVELAYAIGRPQPVEATVTIDGKQETITGHDLTPEGIINKLQLREVGLEERGKWGHF